MTDSKDNKLFIDINATILSALKQMDRLDVKLLLVLSGSKFESLISIGDIQRAIIKNIPFETPIRKILRGNIRVGYSGENFEVIKQRMFHYRMEWIPIIDGNKNLVKIYYWNDVFGGLPVSDRDKLDIPVVIMAGGKGTRLQPITNIIPKALVPLGEKPIIEIIVDNFRKFGTSQFFTSINYKGEMIKFHFDQLTDKDYTMDFFSEDKPLGTAGSLYMLKDKIQSSFFVSNCDILVDQDYHDIYDYHKENNNEVTIVSAMLHYEIPYGILETCDNGLLKKMREKPEFTFKINAGMYILEPTIFDDIKENSFFHITELIEKVQARGGSVGVFPVSGKAWLDIGQWNEYQKTLELFEKRFEK